MTGDPHARVDIDSPFIRELPVFGEPGEHRFHLDNPSHPIISFQVVVVAEDARVSHAYQVNITQPFNDAVARDHILEKLDLANDTQLDIQQIVKYVLTGGPYFLEIPKLDEQLLLLLLDLIEPLNPNSPFI